MLSCMLSREAARRGAIDLNNCGVILLSRRLWGDATDTFKDALRLMKSAANEQGGAVTAQEMQLALYKAWQRTAVAFPTTTTTQVNQEGPILKVISSQCNPATVCAFLNCNGCPQDTKILVTIDPIDFEGWDSDATDLEAACILYNFGMSNGLLSLFGSSGGWAMANHQHNSYRILQLTHNLAYKLFLKAMNKSHLSNPIMLINLLLTLNLAHYASCRNSNDTVTSENLRESLDELVFIIHAHQKLMPVVDHKFAPAA